MDNVDNVKVDENVLCKDKTEDLVEANQPLVKKKRESNLELFRIITMLLIIANHYVVNSGLTNLMDENPLSGQSIFLYFFGAWGKTGINCFVLITGYFMCKSHITLKKFLKLLFEVLFYQILFYLIFLISGYSEFSFTELIKAILPIKSVAYGFGSCYLLFFLFIPFLNILVRNMKEKTAYFTALIGFGYLRNYGNVA